MDEGPKKQRTHFSPKQMLYLEEKFHEKQFPTVTEREDMSKLLDLSQQVIQIWFQNRRAKERRKKKKYGSVSHLKHQPKPPPFWPQNLPFHSNFTCDVKADTTATGHSEEQGSSEDAESDQTLADSLSLETQPLAEVSPSHKQPFSLVEQNSAECGPLIPTPILIASPPVPAASTVEATPVHSWVQLQQPPVITDFSSHIYLQTSPPVAVDAAEYSIHMAHNPLAAGDLSVPLPVQISGGASHGRGEYSQLMRAEESLLCVAEPLSVRFEENQALLAPSASGQYRRSGTALSSTASSLMAKASSSLSSEDNSRSHSALSQGSGVSSSPPQPVVSMDATLPQWGREPSIQSQTERTSISSGISDGNLSLSSSLSGSSHLDVAEARQMEPFSSLILDDFTKFAPIFAEEPIALSDILDSQEWDLMGRTPITTSHQMHPLSIHGPPHQPYSTMAPSLSQTSVHTSHNLGCTHTQSMRHQGPPLYGADLQTVRPHRATLPYIPPDHHGQPLVMVPCSSSALHQAALHGTLRPLATNGFPSTFSRQ